MTPNYRENSFILLLIMLFLTELSRGMFILSYLPAMPAVSSHVTLTIVSLAVTLHFVSDAATNAAVGSFMKHFGAKNVLIVSFLLGFLSFSSVVMFDSNALYLIAAVVLGVAACPIWIITLSSIKDEVRGKQMGIVYFWWMAGLFGGMVLMNFLITIDPRRFVFVLPLIFAINLVILIFTVVNVSIPKKSTFASQIKDLTRIVSAHKFVYPGIVFQAMAIGMLIPILPSYVIRELGLDLNHYTIILAVAAVICGIAIVNIGKALDLFSAKVTKTLLVIGFFVFGGLIMNISQIHGFVTVLVIGSILGIIYGLLLPGWNKYMASRIHPELKEETWGFFNFAQGIGTMIGPLIGGVLVDLTTNLNVTFYVSGAIFVILAIFYTVIFIYKAKFRKNIELL